MLSRLALRAWRPRISPRNPLEAGPSPERCERCLSPSGPPCRDASARPDKLPSIGTNPNVVFRPTIPQTGGRDTDRAGRICAKSHVGHSSFATATADCHDEDPPGIRLSLQWISRACRNIHSCRRRDRQFGHVCFADKLHATLARDRQTRGVLFRGLSYAWEKTLNRRS